jgi:hypothetical protein
MNTFLIEAVSVSGRQPKNAKMQTSTEVDEILSQLWTICPEGTADCAWKPAGEFHFRKRTPTDPVFRVRDFEKGNELKEPRAAGLDILGTYSHGKSTVTIYVDSCLKASRRYDVSPEKLIKVVLVHELAHLMTHRGLPLERTHGEESNHLWEYTAQCATYAHFKERGDKKAFKVFHQLSFHQPFIYRTWEGLKALESVKPQCCDCAQSTQQNVDVVKGVFRALIKPKPALEIEAMVTDYCWCAEV